MIRLLLQMKSIPKFANPLTFLALSIAVLFSGCGTIHQVNSEYDTTIGKKRKTTNVYQDGELSGQLSRVAVLPMFKGEYGHMDLSLIEENIRLELAKLGLFEVISVEPEVMKELFAEERFSSIGVLPVHLVEKLHARYAVDGLLLLDLSYFKAYQPVGIGIRAKLLNSDTGKLVWAADEIFDSSNPEVSNAARKFYKTESIIAFPLHNTKSVLHSPSRFSKYVGNSLFRAINLQKG